MPKRKSNRGVQIKWSQFKLAQFFTSKPNSKNNLIDPQLKVSRNTTSSSTPSVTDGQFLEKIKRRDYSDSEDVTSLSGTDRWSRSTSPSTANFSEDSSSSPKRIDSSNSSIQQGSPRTASITSYEAESVDLSQRTDSFPQKDRISTPPSSSASVSISDQKDQYIKNRQVVTQPNPAFPERIEDIDAYLEEMEQGFDIKEGSRTASLISRGAESGDLSQSRERFSQADHVSTPPSSRTSGSGMDQDDEFIRSFHALEPNTPIEGERGDDIDDFLKMLDREKEVARQKLMDKEEFASLDTPEEGQIKKDADNLLDETRQNLAELIKATFARDPEEESLFDAENIRASFFDDEFDDESLKPGRIARPNTPQGTSDTGHSTALPIEQELPPDEVEAILERSVIQMLAMNKAAGIELSEDDLIRVTMQDPKKPSLADKLKKLDPPPPVVDEKEKIKQQLESINPRLKTYQRMQESKLRLQEKLREDSDRESQRTGISSRTDLNDTNGIFHPRESYSTQSDVEEEGLSDIDKVILEGGPTREEREPTLGEEATLAKITAWNANPEIEASFNALSGKKLHKQDSPKPSGSSANLKQNDLSAAATDMNAGLISGKVFDSAIFDGDKDSVDFTLEDDAGRGTELEDVKHGVERTSFYSTSSYYGSDAESGYEVEVLPTATPQIKNKAEIQYERLMGIAEEIQFAKEFLKNQLKEQRENLLLTRKELDEKFSSLTPKEKRKSRKSESEFESEIVDLKGQILNQSNGLNHLLSYEKNLENYEEQIREQYQLLVETNPDLIRDSLSPNLAPLINAEHLVLSDASKYLLEHNSYIDFIETEKDRNRYVEALEKVEKELQDKLKLAEARLKEMRDKYGSDRLDLSYARMVQNFNSHVESLHAQSENVAFIKKRMNGQQPEFESSLTTPSPKKRKLFSLKKGIRLFGKDKKEQQKELRKMLDHFSKMAPIIEGAKQSVNTLLDIDGPIPHKDGISNYNSMLIDQSLRKHFKDENGKQPYLFKLITPPGENNRYTSFSGPCLHKIKDQTGAVEQAFYLIEGQRRGPLLVAHLNKDQLKNMPPTEIGDKCTVKISSLTEPAIITNNANRPAKAKGLGSFKL